MKVKTVVLSKIPKRIESQSMAIVLLVLLIEMVINNFIPFMLGVYFALTQNVIFFGIFVFMLLFNVRIDYEKKRLVIKLVRGF